MNLIASLRCEISPNFWVPTSQRFLTTGKYPVNTIAIMTLMAHTQKHPQAVTHVWVSHKILSDTSHTDWENPLHRDVDLKFESGTLLFPHPYGGNPVTITKLSPENQSSLTLMGLREVLNESERLEFLNL